MEVRTGEQAINANLTDKQFYALSEYITKLYGIKLPLEKKVMLQSRLRKRLAALNFSCFKDYLDYLFEHEEENEFLIIEVSTNKTDMFRERSHFDYLTETYLPEHLKSRAKNDELKIWSSACSSGEEAYTTAIVLEEFISKNEAFNYKIHATDISTKTLQMAYTGIYNEERIKDLPIELKKKYFLKSKDKASKQVRVKPEIRSKVKYDVLNLMDKVYHTPDEYDIIFCRNVLIYFNKEIQTQVVSRLVDRLKKGGILFIGHSESLMGMSLPLELVKPTIFRKL
jgi:chemotaxis protein methyltransferase CheR